MMLRLVQSNQRRLDYLSNLENKVNSLLKKQVEQLPNCHTPPQTVMTQIVPKHAIHLLSSTKITIS
jgi:hypothetical protein